jgi:hypothetical protein
VKDTNDNAEVRTPERWISKRELAEHLGYTRRWVELRMREGLPSLMIGGQRRYQLSAVMGWLQGDDGLVATS